MRADRADRRARWKGALGLLAGATLLASCVLRNTTEPPHYFAPTFEGGATVGSSAGAATAESQAPVASEGAIPLRLQRVRSASYLGERMVWRSSEVELGIYEQRRWTEPPAELFEQALAARLFQSGALRRSESATAASLEVKLLAFDEVLAPQHVASIRVSVLLEDGQQGPLIDRELAASAPVSGSAGSDVARAMGSALDQITAEIADEVRTRLASAESAKPAGKSRRTH